MRCTCSSGMSVIIDCRGAAHTNLQGEPCLHSQAPRVSCVELVSAGAHQAPRTRLNRICPSLITVQTTPQNLTFFDSSHATLMSNPHGHRSSVSCCWFASKRAYLIRFSSLHFSACQYAESKVTELPVIMELLRFCNQLCVTAF